MPTKNELHDINKKYVSPYDEFMFRFDLEHKKSASQLAEIKKHARIFNMRDNPDYKETDKQIWTEF